MTQHSRSLAGAAALALVLFVGLGATQADPVRSWWADATAPCAIPVDGEAVPLQRDQAHAAVDAAAARAAGGAQRPVSSDLPAGVAEAVASVEDAGAALTCAATPAPRLPEQEITETGLTPRAQEVLDALTETLGQQRVGGFSPDGVSTGHGEESTHYEGRAVDIFVRPVSEEQTRRGWLMAQWLVAHGQELGLQYVIFDDHYWGVDAADQGWQSYAAPAPASDVLRHLDHVHVDVPRGG